MVRHIKIKEEDMYKPVDTTNMITPHLKNGAEISPLVTLEDESGGVAHIWIDDHCYQLGLEREDSKADGPYVVPVAHIFPEAFLALKTLPDLVPA